MTRELFALTRQLIDIPSLTGDEGDVGTFLATYLEDLGYRVEAQKIAPTRFNILATTAQPPHIVFSTHLDTVPPYIGPRLEKSRLYGRGACDAKGIAAAMLCAADRLADAGERRVDLLLVVGEEKGSDGARAANHLQATSRYLVNGEPTESKLASGAKGSQRVVVRTRGRAAHSAYAHLGVSAIEPMLALLPTVKALPLPTDPVLGETTVNIGTIRGGTEANIVPDLCEAELMFRLVGDVAPLRDALSSWAGDRAELEWGSHIPAQHFHTIDGFDVAPVAYTSDIPLLSRWGKPLLFGPGSIHVAHTSEEYIDVKELRQAVDSYERIVRTLLAS